MSTTQTDLETEIGTYAEQLFATGMAGFEAVTIGLGRRLGLYAALAGGVAKTPGQVADDAGVHPRYAREWLEQQAAAGLVSVDDDGGPETRRYSLSPAAEECLLNPDSLASVGPMLDAVVAIGSIFPRIVDAYRSGRGVPFSDYQIHDIQANFNRPGFVNLLTSEWLPAVPGLGDRLGASPPAQVAEIGCGEGWAAISIARAWPMVQVDAYDLDEASIAAARINARGAGVDDRVRFEVVDATRDLKPTGNHDLVFAFETIHDLARPREALTAMRGLGAPDAIYLVIDERVGDAFEAPAENPIERFLYAASVLHCLPVGMAESPSAATGTIMRPATLRQYAADAGFAGVKILPIENDFFRFYQLVDA
jgi:2-polyprenyl-3-methyl-5-hydroxy-6-metoxy-1,4-benzoquinol methylase